MEFIFLTMVPFFDISIEPLTRLVVTITGSISGVSPTAVAIENISALIQSPLVIPLIINTKGAIIAVMMINNFETFLIPMSNVVFFTSLCEISWANLPNIVLSPVAKTIPRPEPETIVVPSYKMLG